MKLRGIDVTIAEVPSAHIRFDAIEVSLGWSSKKVALLGGVVSAVGPRDVVVHQAESWQKRYLARGTAGAEPSTANKTEARISRLAFFLAGPPRLSHGGGQRERRQLRATRRQDRRLRCRGLDLGRARLPVGAGGAHHPRQATRRRLPRRRALCTFARRVLDFVPVTRGGSSRAEEPPLDAPQPSAPPSRAASQSAVAARAMLVKGASLLDATLEQGAKVELDSLHAKILRGRDTLNLGPGSLVIRRDTGNMLVELAPRAQTEREEQALTFALRIPLAESGGEIVADVKGGPLFLSTLGIRDGDFGLFDVAKTALSTRSHLVFSADGKQLRVDGDGRLHNLSLRSDSLSDEPIAGLELAFRLRGDVALDGSSIVVEEGEADLGEIRVLAHGRYDRGADGYRVRADLEMPLTACQSMLDSAPKGLVPRIAGMRMAGSFAIKGHARFDTAKLDRDYDVAWDTANTCRVTEAPAEIDVSRFAQAVPAFGDRPRGRACRDRERPGDGRLGPFRRHLALHGDRRADHRRRRLSPAPRLRQGGDPQLDPREPPQEDASSAARARSACSSRRTSTSTA